MQEKLEKILQEEKNIVKEYGMLCPPEVLKKIPIAVKAYLIHLGMVDGLGLAQELLSEK